MSTRLIGSVIALASCLGMGCTSIGNGLSTSTAPVAASGYCSVITAGGFLANKNKNYPVREGMTVQDLMEDSGQLSRGRDFEIDILRKTNTEMGVVKMPVQFDTSKQRVKFETDYAIHPGDRVLIRPVSFSALDQVAQMMGSSK